MEGIEILPGQMGENFIVDGLDRMAHSIGTCLEMGPALLELTEVRDPCKQLNDSHQDLFKAVQVSKDGEIKYIAGVFARILTGGTVSPGYPVQIPR